MSHISTTASRELVPPIESLCPLGKSPLDLACAKDLLSMVGLIFTNATHAPMQLKLGDSYSFVKKFRVLGKTAINSVFFCA